MSGEITNNWGDPIVAKIVELFRQGKVVLFPSDTLWGISGSIHQPEVIERIYEIKKRPRNLPLILMVSDLEMLKKNVEYIHPRVETMLEYHSRPLTIIHQRVSDEIPDYMCAPDGSIAIRIAMNDFCKKVVSELGHPIVTTSANVHGCKAALNYDEIAPEILDAVDFVVPEKYYQPNSLEPSKIAKYDKNGELEFIR